MSDKLQRITEQDVRDIAFLVLYHRTESSKEKCDKDAESISKSNAMRGLLAKLNEHREPVTHNKEEMAGDKKLSLPARVAGRIFKVGDSESKVIEAAQKQYQYYPSPAIHDNDIYFRNPVKGDIE